MRHVLKNIAFNWLDIVVSTAMVFVLFPRLSAVLGVEQYGVWLLLNAAVGYFSLLMLGIPLSTVRYITKYQAEKNPERVKSVVNTAMLVYASMSLVVLVAGGAMVALVDSAVTLPPELVGRTRWAVLILTLNCAASFPFFVLESILHAFQRFAVVGIVKVTANLVRFALTLVLVGKDNGLPTLAALVALSSLLQFTAYFLYIKARIPGFEFKPWRADRSSLKTITGYSLAVLVFALASRLSFGTDSIVIAKFISASAVVDYAVGANFFVYLTTLMMAISQVLMPKVSLLYSMRGDRAALREPLVRYSEAAAFLSILACGGLSVLGADFIEAWMGHRFAEVSFPVTMILLASYLPFLVQRAAVYPILMGTSKMSAIAAITGVTAIANLGVSIWLAPRLGIEGVAWGTTVPTLMSVIAVTWYLARHLEMSVAEYARRAFLVPAATVPAFALIATVVKRVVGHRGLGGTLTAAALIAVLYGAVAVLLFTRGQPRQALGLAPRVVPRAER